MSEFDPQNALTVAKKDIRDGIRSKLLLGLIAVFVLVIGGGAALIASQSGGDVGIGALFAGFGLVLGILVLVPVTALVVSVKSIVRERESGSLNILLSLPYTRTDVLFGKLLGRATLLTTAVLVGYLPALLILSISVDEFPVTDFLVTILVTILFGFIFVAVGVSLSSFVDTETKATVGGIGAFFALYFWDNILGFIAARFDGINQTGDLFLFVQRFALLNVFRDAVRAILGESSQQIGTIAGSVEIDTGSASVVLLNRAVLSERVQETAAGGAELPAQPFYLQHWFALVIMALWISVPIAIALYRFNDMDL